MNSELFDMLGWAMRDRELFIAVAGIGVLVLVWATVRPSMIKDENGRRLPFKPIPRILFAFICFSVYLMLFAMFYAFPTYASQFAQQTMLGGLFKLPPDTLAPQLSANAAAATLSELSALRSRAPYFAVLLQGLMLQLRFFSDIESALAIWLHNLRHLRTDMHELAGYLASKPFDPSNDERRLNRVYVRKFGLDVADDTLDNVGLIAFEKWEKASTLLRMLKQWMPKSVALFSDDERKHLQALVEAHDRKTELAITIIKLISDQGGHAFRIMNDMPALPTSSDRAAPSRRQLLAEIEGMVASAAPEISQKTLSLTGPQLRKRLLQIQHFFDLEYTDLLDQVSVLTARCVVLSHYKVADTRLERLRDSGFAFLGVMPRVSVDVMLGFFFLVAVPGFLVMFLANRGQTTAEVLARFSTLMAIAALIGVSVGSRKRYARAEDLPWARYLSAGLLSAVIYVCVNLATEILKKALHADPVANGDTLPWPLLVTWSVLPFAVTVSIAVLARRTGWPCPAFLSRAAPYWERLLDGLSVSAVVLLAYFCAMTVHTEAHWKLSPAIQEKMAGQNFFPFPILWQLQAFGLLIGAFVVRDARRVAHRSLLRRENVAVSRDIALSTETMLPRLKLSA